MIDPHNCLLFVLIMLWQHGGHIICHKSPRGWWCHFWWTPDGLMLYEYTPVDPVLGMWFPPIFYHGITRVTAVVNAFARRIR